MGKSSLCLVHRSGGGGGVVFRQRMKGVVMVALEHGERES